MSNQETRDIPKLVGMCLGIMAAMFLVVYLGLVALLQYFPAAESFVGQLLVNISLNGSSLNPKTRLRCHPSKEISPMMPVIGILFD